MKRFWVMEWEQWNGLKTFLSTSISTKKCQQFFWESMPPDLPRGCANTKWTSRHLNPLRKLLDTAIYILPLGVMHIAVYSPDIIICRIYAEIAPSLCAKGLGSYYIIVSMPSQMNETLNVRDVFHCRMQFPSLDKSSAYTFDLIIRHSLYWLTLASSPGPRPHKLMLCHWLLDPYS